MNVDVLKHTGRLLLLMALQLLVLNHIYLGGYITPFIYPLFILMLPFDIKGWALLLSGFGAGLLFDTFADTMGLHAAATTFMAFARPYVVRLISVKTDFEPGAEPSIYSNGLGWMTVYTILLIFVHHFSLFVIETFRSDNLLQMLLRSMLSTSFSTLIIIISLLLISRRTSRRL